MQQQNKNYKKKAGVKAPSSMGSMEGYGKPASKKFNPAGAIIKTIATTNKMMAKGMGKMLKTKKK